MTYESSAVVPQSKHSRAREIRLGLALCLATLSVFPRLAAAAGLPPYACTRDGPDVLVRQADLPSGLLTKVPFEMVDPGQRFETSDVPSFPRLPSHRLICAYPEGTGFVVEWEFGGIVHNRSKTAFRRSDAGYEPQ